MNSYCHMLQMHRVSKPLFSTLYQKQMLWILYFSPECVWQIVSGTAVVESNRRRWEEPLGFWVKEGKWKTTSRCQLKSFSFTGRNTDFKKSTFLTWKGHIRMAQMFSEVNGLITFPSFQLNGTLPLWTVIEMKLLWEHIQSNTGDCIPENTVRLRFHRPNTPRSTFWSARVTFAQSLLV